MLARTLGVLVSLLLAAADAAAQADSLRVILTIGSAFGSAEETFYSVSGVRVAEDGRIVVLDGGEKVVKVFDSEGRFLTMFGREGAGPGEFIRPTRLRLSRDTITVFDVDLARTTFFDFDGKVLSTRPLTGVNEVRIGSEYRLRDGSSLLTTIPTMSPGRAEHSPIWTILIRHGDSLDTVATFGTGAALWQSADGWGAANLTLPGGLWAIGGDSIVALVHGGTGIAQLIRVTESGRQPWLRVDTGVRGTPVTSADLSRLEARKREEHRANGDRLSKITWASVPEYKSSFFSAFFSRSGELWIALRKPDGTPTGEWIAVSPSTRKASRLHLPPRFLLRDATEDRLIGTLRSELGVQTLVVYAR